jgi:hypothetical protein
VAEAQVGPDQLRGLLRRHFSGAGELSQLVEREESRAFAFDWALERCGAILNVA